MPRVEITLETASCLAQTRPTTQAIHTRFASRNPFLSFFPPSLWQKPGTGIIISHHRQNEVCSCFWRSVSSNLPVKVNNKNLRVVQVLSLALARESSVSEVPHYERIFGGWHEADVHSMTASSTGLLLKTIGLKICCPPLKFRVEILLGGRADWLCTSQASRLIHT